MASLRRRSSSSRSSSPSSSRFGFYNRWWRYVSTKDMWRAALGVLVASALAALAVYFADPFERRLPRGVVLMDFVLLLGLVAGTRLAARTIFERPGASRLVARGQGGDRRRRRRRGQLVIREMQRSRQLGYADRLVDDDPRKKNLRVHGVRVLGTTEELPHILRDNRPDELLIAIPSASGEDRQKVVEVARREDAGQDASSLYELIADDLRTLRARSGPCRWRTSLAASRSRSTSMRSRSTSRARRFSSPAPAARSARGSAARSASPPRAARAGRPGRDGALRDRARAGRRARLRRASRCSPTSPTGPGCGASSSGTARRSSSTPPPTSVHR